VISDGTLWTWGRNDLGALGDGTTDTTSTPKPVPNFTLTSNALWSFDSDGDGLSNGMSSPWARMEGSSTPTAMAFRMAPLGRPA
jgi:alpha-tubulin suppressor-like RCC1 family protein